MSANSISCPHCGKIIDIDAALKHQVEEQLLSEERKKHSQEMANLREQTFKEAKEKSNQEFEFKLKMTTEENREVKERSQTLEKQVLELIKKVNKKDEEQQEQRIEFEKKHNEDLELVRLKVKEQAEKQISEDYQRRIAEKDKKIEDATRANEELRRKLEQGSQQTQGEVVELQLEETLRSSFPSDSIEPIGKGVNGADIRQVVKSPNGTICGIILWESKQTKSFGKDWIGKLKNDAIAEKASVSALVTAAYPESNWNGMILNDGVWVCAFTLVLPMAALLRKAIIDVARQKATQQQRGNKESLVYDYITGPEFQQQIIALRDVFLEMSKQIHNERVVFEKQWKQREGQLARLVTNTAGIYGSLQGRVGSSAIPAISGLDVLELAE